MMLDVKTADRELHFYIRPQTFPVAIRMLWPGEKIPDRARRPARNFKKLSMNCQVVDMARRYGWMIALTHEDRICSLGIAALGFERPTHLHSSGTLCEGMYTETKDAGQCSEATIDRFAVGEYHALLVAPLDRATLSGSDFGFLDMEAESRHVRRSACAQLGRTVTGLTLKCGAAVLGGAERRTSRYGVPGTVGGRGCREGLLRQEGLCSA